MHPENSPAQTGLAGAPGTGRHARRRAEAGSADALTPEAVLERQDWRERAAAATPTDGLDAFGSPGLPPALERRPDAPLGRRIGRAVAVPAAAGTVAFLIAVVIAIVLTALQLRPAAEAAEEITRSVGEAAPRGETAGGGQDPDASSERAQPTASGSAAPVLVHVVGEVKSPGVVELPAESRVADAIEAAGGVGEAAVLSGVNLARTVADGEQILVPNAEQAASGGGAAAGAAGSSGSTAPSEAGTGSGPLNLNAADAAALETLPRVGPALAQRIIDWREANGGFTSVEQLLEVSGIGAKTLDGFRELVTV
ncbi:ComEA family DNA-binding protein [Leucobacter sp. wl10]|uniref:ComEA family DNA-binding protein n=1 Tax=Leucobacter sp. wl10 TaxID=2304677 RepID=UPI000E5AB6C5|nr:ComEA family DNA-binding protein [Leucobacter sp. wl10]RGE22394.1 ComEA family DNA-binding protein [Leucobacter sp. wl10]